MNPQQDPKQIILQTLTIIDYQDDKNAYADKFLELCQQRAALVLLKSLTEEKQKQLEEELKTNTSPEQIQEVLKRYFTQEELFKASEKAAELAFKQFLQSVIPTLSKDQKDKLQAYLSSLQPQK